MKEKIEVLIARYEKLALQNARGDDGDVFEDGDPFGQVDDAFYAGEEEGAIYKSREIVADLKALLAQIN